MAMKLEVNGDKIMRTILTLSALGLTLALGGAAVASPLQRSAGYGTEQMQTYRLHKKIYRHTQERSVSMDRDRSASGMASSAVRKPS
jgi:hypothetical protein